MEIEFSALHEVEDVRGIVTCRGCGAAVVLLLGSDDSERTHREWHAELDRTRGLADMNKLIN